MGDPRADRTDEWLNRLKLAGTLFDASINAKNEAGSMQGLADVLAGGT